VPNGTSKQLYVILLSIKKFIKMKRNLFRSGILAAALGLALGAASCSDDFDYESSSDQSFGFYGSETIGVAYDPLTGDSVQQYAGLVISEIYFTGSGNNPNSGGLINDQYIRITNNSDDSIDVGGVAVLESKFNSVTAYTDFTPPIDDADFVTGVIFQVPASKPLASGESILLAPYRKSYTDSTGLNLSCADYEWNVNSGTGSLTKVFSYSLTTWVLHNRGFSSYAIAALPGGYYSENDTTALNNLGWKYTGTYNLNVGGTVYPYTATKAYAIPNEWIIDAVNVQAPVYTSNVVPTLPEVLDEGYTYAGDTTNNNSTTRFRHKVIRNIVSGKYLDTNNSLNDFHANDTISAVCN
jgi:hypothetical protein